MGTFKLTLLAMRDKKGKVKEFEAGREYLLKINEDEWKTHTNQMQIIN